MSEQRKCQFNTTHQFPRLVIVQLGAALRRVEAALDHGLKSGRQAGRAQEWESHNNVAQQSGIENVKLETNEGLCLVFM